MGIPPSQEGIVHCVCLYFKWEQYIHLCVPIHYANILEKHSCKHHIARKLSQDDKISIWFLCVPTGGLKLLSIVSPSNVWSTADHTLYSHSWKTFVQALIAGKLSLVSSPDPAHIPLYMGWFWVWDRDCSDVWSTSCFSTDECKLLSIVSPRIVSMLITVS